MADAHKNFAESLVATAPSPATTGTSLVVTGGEGTLFPTVPFNATVWPAGEQPTLENAEIIRVTAISTDTFTITRAQEGTSARNIIVGDQITASITNKTLREVENPVGTWSPYIFSSASASSVQKLASATSVYGTGSMIVFPITVNGNVEFNQAVLPVSLSYITTNNAGTDSYYSYFALYSMNASTALSRMAAGSFSMVESYNGAARTWSYPTTTNTSGYGYDTLAMSMSAQVVQYVSGTRWFGLQFGSEMHLTNGIYWMGLLSIRNTAGGGNSSGGLSVAGVIGQPIDAYHSLGSVSGLLPIGSAASLWGGTNAANSTQWWGRHMMGVVTATSITNYLGTTTPASIALTAFAGSSANATMSVLPAITLQSNLMT